MFQYGYEFNIGDEVVSIDGISYIEDICECSECRKRGFFELRLCKQNGEYVDYVTDCDYRNGFKSYYKIGENYFNTTEGMVEKVRENIDVLKKEVEDKLREIDVLEKLSL